MAIANLDCASVQIPIEIYTSNKQDQSIVVAKLLV